MFSHIYEILWVKYHNISIIYHWNFKFQWTLIQYIGEKYLYWYFTAFLGNQGRSMRSNFKMPWNFSCWGIAKRFSMHWTKPLRQVCPFLYKLQQVYIYSNSSYKHNIKKSFKEQINYNYFIIKWKIFIYLNIKNIKLS